MVVLPGFGYDRDGERAFRALAPSMATEGFDLYLPTFVSRSGLEDSRERLQRFFQERHLDRYRRVHVFAFIAGGWTLNPLAEAGVLAYVIHFGRQAVAANETGDVDDAPDVVPTG